MVKGLEARTRSSLLLLELSGAGRKLEQQAETS